MSAEYESTTEQLFDITTTAIGLASLSAGRIGSGDRPSLIEKQMQYSITKPGGMGPPPKFSDLFDGVDNSQDNILRLDDQVDQWLAKYFPAINNGFKDVPDEWLMQVIGGVKPFGIDSTIFDVVWQQARNRAYRTANSERRTLEAEFSMRGFRLPPGALVDAISQAEQRATEAALDVNRDQAMKDAEIKADILKHAVGIAAQLKTSILNTSAEFFRAYYGLYQLDAETQRTRAQAYSAYYAALRSFYDVEISWEELKVRAARDAAAISGGIDQNRVSVFDSGSAATGHAQASRGFADIASSASSAAGTLVANIEAV